MGWKRRRQVAHGRYCVAISKQPEDSRVPLLCHHLVNGILTTSTNFFTVFLRLQAPAGQRIPCKQSSEIIRVSHNKLLTSAAIGFDSQAALQRTGRI